MTANKVTVGLVYGGKSGEHDISLQTGFAVMNAFDYDRYEIVPFYITPQGEWRMGSVLDGPMNSAEQMKLESGSGGTAEATAALFASLSGRESGIDVMFPLLHGTFGEDGTVQGLFEMAGLPYVGAGVLSSSAGMDKDVMKKLFAAAGLEQGEYIAFVERDWRVNRHELLQEAESKLGYPCFVKPANLGSSVGISKAADQEALIDAVELALRYDRKVLIEAFIDGRELEVGVLGNDEPQASVPGEIASSGEYYDYNAKYIDGKSEMMIPAPVDPDLADSLRDQAVRAFKAVEGSGLCRADFFVRRSDNKILINEVNTMPGFTPFSMYPLLWRETGMSYTVLLDRLIQLALERHEARTNLQYGR
ncbi:D-alanine--D-alanine ligase [Saccharibacillus sp. CPCC 101409]|uniref:D-alanine--D-alanine ligase n=1 Tax=Saccharibacillus sp. CPCC 101409 TaxID=3058041 RepID=UPI002672F6FF|nr:D-alanine--D-alanine ligase [Saccharibacillus sp. CPCC 101409]MDO3412665.1 D-alanine--D-alanine ligase [Saccharibacillus sp. CPCC 101409]